MDGPRPLNDDEDVAADDAERKELRDKHVTALSQAMVAMYKDMGPDEALHYVACNIQQMMNHQDMLADASEQKNAAEAMGMKAN